MKKGFFSDYRAQTLPKERETASWNAAQKNEKAISGAIKIDEEEIRTHLDGLVRQSVENILNALSNAGPDAICQASNLCSPDRQNTRAGSYKRKLLTKAGEVKLYVPRQRTLPLKMQVIERHKTKQNSLAAAAHRFAMNTTARERHNHQV